MSTRNPAFLILHNPPPIREQERAFAAAGFTVRQLEELVLAPSAQPARTTNSTI